MDLLGELADSAILALDCGFAVACWPAVYILYPWPCSLPTPIPNMSDFQFALVHPHIDFVFITFTIWKKEEAFKILFQNLPQIKKIIINVKKK